MANDYSTVTVKQVMDAITAIITNGQNAITSAESTLTGEANAPALVEAIQNAQAQIDDATNKMTLLQGFVDATFFPPAS